MDLKQVAHVETTTPIKSCGERLHRLVSPPRNCTGETAARSYTDQFLRRDERRAAYTEGPPNETGQYLWMTVTKAKEPDVGETVFEYR
jgi:hypothetical protein